MDSFKFLTSLRSELIIQIQGIENAGYSLWWDNSTSNYITRRELTKILKKYIEFASVHGVLIVTRHCDCPNKRHPEYPTSNRYGQSIPYLSKEYIWEGRQLYQGKRFCTCPCSSHNPETEHHVIDDFVFKKGSDLNLCRAIALVLSDIANALANSGDRQPRSGIREYLLRALLTLHDAILPEPIELYIASKLNRNN